MAAIEVVEPEVLPAAEVYTDLVPGEGSNKSVSAAFASKDEHGLVRAIAGSRASDLSGRRGSIRQV